MGVLDSTSAASISIVYWEWAGPEMHGCVLGLMFGPSLARCGRHVVGGLGAVGVRLGVGPRCRLKAVRKPLKPLKEYEFQKSECTSEVADVTLPNTDPPGCVSGVNH